MLDRVTKLGELSLIVRLFSLVSFLKVAEVAQLFSHAKSCVLILAKNGSGCILGCVFLQTPLVALSPNRSQIDRWTVGGTGTNNNKKIIQKNRSNGESRFGQIVVGQTKAALARAIFSQISSGSKRSVATRDFFADLLWRKCTNCHPDQSGLRKGIA
jgi:hypothetical protein